MSALDESALGIRVNGTIEAFAATIAELLVAKGLDHAKGLAVAVNDRVVPRSAWMTTRLAPDDQVEIVRAVGGG
ncbi:sulfur carrier protein ThiS [Acidiphilium sp.]|uniref:sulfur carrier protein ThiS n=1 Tax=Acidiphilium sp. TaxID=527 RepID=UPI003D053173